MRFSQFKSSGRLGTLALSGAALLASLTSGCVENRSTLFVSGVMAETDDCTFEADPEAKMLGAGTFVPGMGKDYRVYVLLGNQLTKVGDANTLKSETSYFQVEGVEVNLLSGDGTSTIQSFSALASRTIPPGTSSSPGYAATPLTLIPADADLSPGDSVVVEFRFYGTSLGGAELESGWTTFSVSVVSGEEIWGMDYVKGCYCAGYPIECST